MLIFSFYLNKLLKKMKLLAYYKFDLAKYLVIRKNCDKFLGVKWTYLVNCHAWSQNSSIEKFKKCLYNLGQLDAKMILSKLLWLLTIEKVIIENKASVRHNDFRRIYNQIDYKQCTIVIWNLFVDELRRGDILFSKNYANLLTDLPWFSNFYGNSKNQLSS